MDSSFESIASYDDLSSNNTPRKGDISICSQLAGFKRLQISALTHAAAISPLVKEVTIGPNSPLNKETASKEVPLVEDKVEENLIEDKVRQDLRCSLLMKRCENELQETSSVLFMNILESMFIRRTECMMQFCKKQGEDCERTSMALKSRKLQMLKVLQENDNSSLLEKAKLDEKNSHVANSQTIENMNRVLEEQNKATARFVAITDCYTKICICYNEVCNVLQTDPLAKSFYQKYATALNTVLANINFIMDICKTGTVTDKDVTQAEVLTSNIENIKKKLLNDIYLLKKEEEARKQKEEAQIKKKAEEERIAQETKPTSVVVADKTKSELKHTPPVFHSSRNYSYYEELKHFLQQYEAQYAELLQDVKLKKFRFDCQKAVNTPVNALSSVSASHMKDKYEKLFKLLKGERVQVLDIYVTATQHPQGLAYCTALLAKKIVRQGDLLVSSNLDAAFPLAAVTVSLWSQFPQFGKLVEAYFHSLCPYLVPMFLPQKQGQSDKEFYMSRGYTYNDEGVVEKQDKFLKRMSGIFRLRCAIWITDMPRFLNGQNPHGLKYGWQWLASFINLKPEPDISATLLHEFFIICGAKFKKQYGVQFIKVIQLVSSQYLKILDNIDEGGPKTRLEVYLQTVLKSGQVPPAPVQPISW